MSEIKIYDIDGWNIKEFIDSYLKLNKDDQNKLVQNIVNSFGCIEIELNTYFLWFILSKSNYNSSLKLPYWNNQQFKYVDTYSVNKYLHCKHLVNISKKYIDLDIRKNILDTFSNLNDLNSFKLFFSYDLECKDYIDNFRKFGNTEAVRFILYHSKTEYEPIYKLYMKGGKCKFTKYDELTDEECIEIIKILSRTDRCETLTKISELYSHHKNLDLQIICEIFDINHFLIGIKWILSMKKYSFKYTWKYLLEEEEKGHNIWRNNETSKFIDMILPHISIQDLNWKKLVDICVNTSINRMMNIIGILKILDVKKVMNYIADNHELDHVFTLYKKFKVIDTEYIVDVVINKKSTFSNIYWIINNLIFDKTKLNNCAYNQECVDNFNTMVLLNDNIELDYKKILSLTTNNKVYDFIKNFEPTIIINKEIYRYYAKTNNFIKFKELFELNFIDLSDDEFLNIFIDNKNTEAVKWIVRKSI